MTWITIAAGAALVSRPPRTIYDWVAQGRIRTQLSPAGITTIDAEHLLEVEPTIRPGRPQGSAAPATHPIRVLDSMSQTSQGAERRSRSLPKSDQS